MSASFQIEESGLSHQEPMPEVKSFKDLPSEHELRNKIIDKLPEEYKAVSYTHLTLPTISDV